MTQASSFKNGAIINDRYVIESRIGTGGYGEVLAAHDRQLGRDVALKVLHTDATENDPRAAERMRQEAEILRAINHPNIVRIFEVGSVERAQFLVMERIDGFGLDELLLRDGVLDSDRLLPLVLQLLDALDAAHNTQILHRDLKPENILIVATPDKEVVKLVDFGVAKATDSLQNDDPDDAVTLVKTRVGNFVGTPRYAAPEMVVGDPVGPPADLFCVGLVVFEALCGEPLIKGTNRSAIMNELVFPRPFDLSLVPEPWRPWLQQMLEKHPDHRFQSAAEARLALLDSLSHTDEFQTATLEEPFVPQEFGSLSDEELNVATSTWQALDIDYDALEQNRQQAFAQAIKSQELTQAHQIKEEKLELAELPLPESENNLLLFTVVALVTFVVLAGIYLLYTGFFSG